MSHPDPIDLPGMPLPPFLPPEDDGATSDVHVYPVGWLAALRQARQPLLREARYARHWIKTRNWRAAKNSLNGYLAEPYEFPPGDYRRRAGSGWTKRRALRSLARHLPPGRVPAERRR